MKAQLKPWTYKYQSENLKNMCSSWVKNLPMKFNSTEKIRCDPTDKVTGRSMLHRTSEENFATKSEELNRFLNEKNSSRIGIY